MAAWPRSWPAVVAQHTFVSWPGVAAGGTPTPESESPPHPQVLSAFHVGPALSEGAEHRPAFQVQVIKVGYATRGEGAGWAQLGGLTQGQWDEHSASPWWWRWGAVQALGMDRVVLRQGSGQTGSKGRVGPSCLWRSW